MQESYQPLESLREVVEAERGVPGPRCARCGTRLPPAARPDAGAGLFLLWVIGEPVSALALLAVVAGSAALAGVVAGVVVAVVGGIIWWRLHPRRCRACGRWVSARQLRRWQRGECVHCGYDLTGNASGTCPECGSKIETDDES